MLFHPISVSEINHWVAAAALDDLEDFSHVWITFKFHLNTNVLKEAKAFNGVQNDSKRFTFSAKITPPVTNELNYVFNLCILSISLLFIFNFNFIDDQTAGWSAVDSVSAQAQPHWYTTP